MSRKKLAGRRYSESMTFWFEGRRHDVGLGFYPDGRLAELFVECAQVGSTMNLLMKEAGIAISFALQHGCTVETMRKAMPRNSDGTSEGFVGAVLDRLATLETAAE